MDLPKIKNENLPEELKNILGDADAEFDAIVDPADVINIQHDPDLYYETRMSVAQKLLESRKRMEELRTEQRLNKSKEIE